ARQPRGAMITRLGVPRLGSGQVAASAFAVLLVLQPSVPRVWDARELASFELPLARADRSAQHATPDYYYRMAVRPIFKSYPIYAPGREPAGSMDWLAQQEPELAFDVTAIASDADWRVAGETVFDAPIGYGATFRSHRCAILRGTKIR